VNGRRDAWRRRPGKLAVASSLAAFFCLFGLFTALAYLVVRKIPSLSEFWAVFLSGLSSFALLCTLAAGLSLTRLHRFKHARSEAVYDAVSAVLNAFGEVARGNFDTFIKPDPQTPHSEIIDAFNEMVKNLGSPESMRQDFISNVSHEIQSPLTSIKGFAALLQNDALPPDERRRCAEIIEAESDRLSSLSDNLLKLSALDGEKKPLNVTEYRLDRQLGSVALALEPQWSAKQLALEADPEECTISGDEQLLSQAWRNLLHKALRKNAEARRGRRELQRERGRVFRLSRAQRRGKNHDDLHPHHDARQNVRRRADRGL
jgi:signal transduction histidine kinase